MRSYERIGVALIISLFWVTQLKGITLADLNAVAQTAGKIQENSLAQDDAAKKAEEKAAQPGATEEDKQKAKEEREKANQLQQQSAQAKKDLNDLTAHYNKSGSNQGLPSDKVSPPQKQNTGGSEAKLKGEAPSAPSMENPASPQVAKAEGSPTSQSSPSNNPPSAAEIPKTPTDVIPNLDTAAKQLGEIARQDWNKMATDHFQKQGASPGDAKKLADQQYQQNKAAYDKTFQTHDQSPNSQSNTSPSESLSNKLAPQESNISRTPTDGSGASSSKAEPPSSSPKTPESNITKATTEPAGPSTGNAAAKTVPKSETSGTPPESAASPKGAMDKELSQVKEAINQAQEKIFSKQDLKMAPEKLQATGLQAAQSLGKFGESGVNAANKAIHDQMVREVAAHMKEPKSVVRATLKEAGAEWLKGRTPTDAFARDVLGAHNVYSDPAKTTAKVTETYMRQNGLTSPKQISPEGANYIKQASNYLQGFHDYGVAQAKGLAQAPQLSGANLELAKTAAMANSFSLGAVYGASGTQLMPHPALMQALPVPAGPWKR